MKHSELQEMIRRVVQEKKLTAAEKKKKEQIVKGMKKSFKGDEASMYAIATAKAKKIAEGEDHEVSMAQNSLEAIAKAIVELRQKLGNQERNIPGWIQDHIAKAENYIEQAAQGFHELNEEKDPLDVVVAEKKGKDLDGDGDIDSADYLKARDIAIKKAQANEARQIATTYQFSPEQFKVLKDFGVKLSTNGQELYIPEVLYIDLQQNKKDSKFKQEMYNTVSPSDEYLVSQILTAMKKSLKNTVRLKNQTYFTLPGTLTKNGNFNFPNPYRK